MTCDCCRLMDLDKLLSYTRTPHHATFNELATCANNGDCALCEWIRDDLEFELRGRGFNPNSNDGAQIFYGDHPITMDSEGIIEKEHGFCVVSFGVSIGEEYLKRLASVELFVPRGSKLAESRIISGRPISPSAGDGACFELGRTWIYNCLQNHRKTCPGGVEWRLPTRVIDVGPADGSREPWLRITKRDKGIWVALSHCWGTEARFVTDSDNILSRKRIIPLKNMPPTFSDAITATRQLGYRYLWIDSLCIIQNNHDDWVAESTRMRDYYKHAIVTISADSATGDHVGFLKQRQMSAESLSLTLTSGDEIGFRGVITTKMFRDRDTFLTQRAWALQEFVLSPRVILFTPDQIYWECETRKYCESHQGESEFEVEYTLKRFLSASSVGRELFPNAGELFDPSYRWYSFVEEYIFRDLTNKDDVFPAISGLAREIQKQTAYTYAAGIWLEDFHNGLLWVRDGRGKALESYYAPSWSWASLATLPESLFRNLQFHVHRGTLTEIVERRASLLAHEIVFKDEDHYGRVTFGSIRIRGKALPAKKWQGKTKPYFRSYKASELSHFHENVDNSDQLICSFDIFQKDSMAATTLNKVLLFQISTWIVDSKAVSMALLLLPAENSLADTYRRVGIAEIPNIYSLAEDGWEVIEVCII